MTEDKVKLIYCMDREISERLKQDYKLLKQDVVSNKPCWVFIVDDINSFNLKFSDVGSGKIIISNRLTF